MTIGEEMTIETARKRLRAETETIEPGELARLDQVAAEARDAGLDGETLIQEGEEALDRAGLDEDLALVACDVVTVGLLVVIGSAS